MARMGLMMFLMLLLAAAQVGAAAPAVEGKAKPARNAKADEAAKGAFCRSVLRKPFGATCEPLAGLVRARIAT